MKKLVALLLVVGFVAFLFGCSNENSWSNIMEDISEPKTGIITDKGQLPAPIIFDSGARLETTEDNTLVENVVVNVTETKSYDIGRNPIGTPEYIYIYGITAKKVDSQGNSTEVNSLKKPFRLVLPAGHLGKEGICYAGVREDKNSSWKYTRLPEKGITTLSQRSIRAAGSENIQPSYEFSLYRMGIEIALFVYNKPPEEAQKDISGSGITATPTTPLLTISDNGNYLDNLDIDIKLTGDNLSGLKSSDFIISIIYRNQKSTPAEIKINNLLPQKTESNNDEAVTGKDNYVHILNLGDSNFTASFNGEVTIGFTLNLKDKSISDFPTDFIVKVSSVDNIENLIPFTYTNNVSYKTEKALTVYTINYDLDDGSLATGDSNPDKYTTASETFTLKNPVKEGYTFAGWTGTDLKEATKEVTIEKGSTGNREYKATWIQNAPDTYALTVLKGTGVATVSEGGNYEVGKEITLECTPSDGYKFISWTSDEVSVTGNKFTMPAKDVTVTANASVITYNINYYGLEGATFAGGVTNSEEYDVASADITLNNPTKDGYTFKGWSGDGLTGDENKTVTIAHGSTGNKSYTANWTLINYTISYELNSGSLEGGVINPESYNITSASINLHNPVRVGYDFIGWTGTDIEEGSASMTVTIPQGSIGNREYVASWTEIPSIITLDLQGGDLSAFSWVVDNKIIYTSASGTFKLPKPVKTDYDFVGWIYGENPPVKEVEISAAENRTYVASWTLAFLTFTLPGDITLEMRHCPAGSFVRGGIKGDGNTVTISKDFYMGTYEVTNAQYAAIMGSSPSVDAGSEFAGANQPVVYIKWDVIMSEPSGFIAQINSQLADQLPIGYKFALPTEAQWEYACRAETETDFNNGGTMTVEYGDDSAMNEVGWYYCNCSEIVGATHDVGGLASNSFGIYDMHGNVFEWCSDWYDETYDSSNLTDPTGPDTGYSRVLRGGSWNFYPYHCTSWYRFSFTPSHGSDNFGFRLALVPVALE